MPKKATERACPGVEQLNVAKWIREHTDLLLRHPDPATGEMILDYANAYPVTLAPVLRGLQVKTNSTLVAIYSMPASEEKTRLLEEYALWKERLDRYVAFNDAALASTPTSSASIWWCVTMPLTLGWYPNANCTDVDPDQKYQADPDVATPLILTNQALCAGAFYDTQNFGKYWEYVHESAGELPAIAGHYVDAAADLASNAFDNLKSYVSVSRKIVPWVAGAVIVAGIAYLAFRSGPAKRT
jgi:hypothetical protein